MASRPTRALRGLGRGTRWHLIKQGNVFGACRRQFAVWGELVDRLGQVPSYPGDQFIAGQPGLHREGSKGFIIYCRFDLVWPNRLVGSGANP